MKQQHKFTEIESGQISEDWDIKPAEMFCSRVTDGTHDSPKKQEQGKYLITSRHLKDGYLDFSNAYYIKEEDFIDANRRSKVDRWDVLFSMIGTIGEVYLEKADKIGYAIKNVGLFKSGGEELKGKWIFYYLRSKEAKEYIRKSRAGTTQEYITLDSLRKFPICFPKDENEMQQIVNILDSIQDKLEICKQINITLEKIGQALFKHWFKDFEFPNEKGKPYKSSGGKMVDSELGEIPQGWKVKKVGEVIEIFAGTTPSTKEQKYWEGGTIHWATPKDLSDLDSPVLTDTERKITPEGLATISSGLLQVGTVLLSSRAPIGYTAISQMPVSINQGFIAMVCNRELPNYYVFSWVQYNLDIIKSVASGTTFEEVNKTNFRRLNILVPPPALLSKFSALFGSLYECILNNSFQSRTLVSARDSLLPRLMLGQIRVPAG